MCLGMSSMRTECSRHCAICERSQAQEKDNSLCSHIKGSFTILIPKINISIDLNSHCINTQSTIKHMWLWLGWKFTHNHFEEMSFRIHSEK